MGAHTFTQTHGGKKLEPRDAYAQLVNEAIHDSGHDPYNGTISTTSGFVMVDCGKRRPKTMIREICDHKNSDYSHIEKWGPAGCIELKGSNLRDWKARNGLSGTRARAYVFFGWAAS